MSADVDLDVWLSGEATDRPSCGAVRNPCSNEAVAVAHWSKSCGHYPGREQPLCVPHRDMTIRNARLMNGLFTCWCCPALARLLGMATIW